MSAHNLRDGEAMHFDLNGKPIARSRWKDESGRVLRDREVLYVPMMLSDAAPKAIATDAEVIAAAKAVRDGAAPVIDAANQRPRSVVFGDAEKQAREDRQAAYDKRASDAWKQQPPPIADMSKLGGFINAMGAQTAEAGFKTATMTPEPVDLEQARARADARLSNAWRNPV